MEANTVLPITPERQRIVWDAAMDLFLLRQIRGTGNPFLRGSTAMEEVVVILSQQDQRFSGLRKKGATDRLHLLMTKFQAKETRSKAASGVSEEFTEADALLTELVALKKEKEEAAASQSAAQKNEKQIAETLRQDACKKLSEKQSTEGRAGGSQRSPRTSASSQRDVEPVKELIQYLETKNNAMRTLEERKLKLEEDKFNSTSSKESVELEARKLALQVRFLH